MIYCIASRLGGGEYLVINPHFVNLPNQPFGPLCFNTVADAKSYFVPFYQVLKRKRHSSQYTLEKLLMIHPVIIAIPVITRESILQEWGGQIVPRGPVQIINYPHRLLSVKEGFIDKFLVLDIVKDIHSN